MTTMTEAKNTGREGCAPITRDSELLALMREHGWTELRLSFSGGNDEGGCDHLTAKTEQGIVYLETPGTATEADRAWDWMELLVGSFTGDCYVSGVVVADLATGRVGFHDVEKRERESYSDEG